MRIRISNRDRRLLRRARIGRVQPGSGPEPGAGGENALVTAGIAADRIRVISYGKEKPFCSDSTEECWQLNRRDGFTIDK
jgi:hypothetical protein